MQRLDLQDELCRTRQRFLKKHSGMEQYLRREKALLLVLMLFVCAHKLSVLFAAGSELTVSGLIGAMLGIGLPAFFALAVYSGRWQYGLFFFLLGGYLAFDLFDFGVTTLPRLLNGSLVLAGSPLWFYCLALTEALCTAVSFFAAYWLTLVPKNRTFAELARRMNIECGRIARESAEQDN